MKSPAPTFHALRAAAARNGTLDAFDAANGTTAAGTTPDAPAAKRRPRGMNRWEREYAEHLEHRRRAGELVWWAFEPVKLRLAEGAWYTPDFCVMWPNGKIECEEVKGFWREAARVRIKVAASLYPWPFWVVTKDGRRWRYELMPARDDIRPGPAETNYPEKT